MLQTFTVFSGSFLLGSVLIIVLQILAIGNLVEGVLGFFDTGQSYDTSYDTGNYDTSPNCNAPSNDSERAWCRQQYRTGWIEHHRRSENPPAQLREPAGLTDHLE